MSFQEGDVSGQTNRKAQVTSVATTRSRVHTFAMGPCSYCKTPSSGSEEQPRAGQCFLSEEYGGLPKSSLWWRPGLEFSLWTHSVTGEQFSCLNIDGLCHLRCPRVSKSSTCTWQTPDWVYRWPMPFWFCTKRPSVTSYGIKNAIVFYVRQLNHTLMAGHLHHT